MNHSLQSSDQLNDEDIQHTPSDCLINNQFTLTKIGVGFIRSYHRYTYPNTPFSKADSSIFNFRLFSKKIEQNRLWPLNNPDMLSINIRLICANFLIDLTNKRHPADKNG